MSTSPQDYWRHLHINIELTNKFKNNYRVFVPVWDDSFGSENVSGNKVCKNESGNSLPLKVARFWIHQKSKFNKILYLRSNNFFLWVSVTGFCHFWFTLNRIKTLGKTKVQLSTGLYVLFPDTNYPQKYTIFWLVLSQISIPWFYLHVLCTVFWNAWLID